MTLIRVLAAAFMIGRGTSIDSMDRTGIEILQQSAGEEVGLIANGVAHSLALTIRLGPTDGSQDIVQPNANIWTPPFMTCEVRRGVRMPRVMTSQIPSDQAGDIDTIEQCLAR